MSSSQFVLHQLQTVLVALFLLVTALPAWAQYGHPGVTVDPTPLVQVKRPRKPVLQSAAARHPVARKSDQPARPASPSVPKPGAGSEVAVKRPTPDPQPRPNPSNPPSRVVTKAGQGAVPVTEKTPAATTPLSPFEAVIAQAEEVDDANDPKAAAELYRQALTLRPESGDAHWGLADALYAQHDYEAAIKQYDAALAAGENDAGLYNNYANALFRSGTVANRERSISRYQQAIQQDAQSADARAGLANALRVQRKLSEARQSAERAVQLDPDSSLAHSVLGRVLADQQDFPKAIAEANKGIALARRDAFAWINLGGIYYLQGEWMEALKAYLTARSLDPDWALPYNNLGNTWMAMKRPPDAARNFLEAIKREPNSPTLYNNLGGAYAAQGKFGEAIPAFKRAAQLDPGNAFPHANLGGLYADQRRYAEALAEFTRAVALDPTNPKYQTALGDVYKLTGKKKEAQAAYKRAQELIKKE